MTLPVFLDPDQINLIESSFPKLLAARPSLVEQFYQRLAEDFPEIFQLFKEAEPAGQQQKLLAAMTLLVTNLHEPKLLNTYFQDLADRHYQYGVDNAMFEPFNATFLKVIGDCLDKDDVVPVTNAWQQLLRYVSAMMQRSTTTLETDRIDTDSDKLRQPHAMHIADLLAEQHRLITQMTITVTRQQGDPQLLSDLAELHLLNKALQKTVTQKPKL